MNFCKYFFTKIFNNLLMLKNYLQDILIYNQILIISRGFSHHSLIFTKLLNIHKI